MLQAPQHVGNMPEITNEVIIERLDTFIQLNKEDHQTIKVELQKIYGDHEERIKALEYWKIQFVAKFSVYASLGVFLGTVAAQVLIKIIFK